MKIIKTTISLFAILLSTLLTKVESQERSLDEDRAQINQTENTVIGKLAEEVTRLEHGAVESFKAEAARDKKIITSRPNTSAEVNKVAPSLESIQADLEAREKLAQEIENEDDK
jgi:type II secretory pathway component PulM